MCVGQNDEILSGLVKGVITSCQTNKIVETKNGDLVNEQILNDNAFWTKMHSVASNTFGHTVYELNEWERTGNDAPRNMCSERAEDIMRDVFDIGQSMRRAIDAKSSESIGVNRQTQNTTILGMMGKNKQERVITFKDQAKKSLFSSFMGKESDRAADEE
mgnify:FL=1|jgi:hypothetical protein|tara:strand:+ start:3926 stop:4405 length:480 start_codon:yes stop_codon:yes gene_type:complete